MYYLFDVAATKKNLYGSLGSPDGTTTDFLKNKNDNLDDDEHDEDDPLLLHHRIGTIDDDDQREQQLLDIDEAIQRLGLGVVQFRAMAATGLLLTADAMEVVLLSFLSHVAERRFNVDDSSDNAATANTTDADADDDGSDSLLRTVVFPAALAGAIVWGVLGDVWGRRVILVATSALVAVLGLATALVTSYPLLVATRCGVSFGIGGMTVGFDLCAELLPPHMRGKGLALVQVFWTIGAMVAHLALRDQEDNNSTATAGEEGQNDGSILNARWRWVAGLCALPSVAALVLAMTVVSDSPRWLLAKERHEEALHVLRRAAEANGKDPLTTFPERVILYSHEPCHDHHHHRHCDDESASGRAWSSFCQVFQLCSGGWMSLTAALWTTYFGKAFLDHGSISMAVNVFANDDRQQEYQTIFTAASECLGLLLVFITIDRWGRSMTQCLCYASAGVFCLTLSLFQDYGPSVNPNLLLLLVFLSHLFVRSGTIATWIATTEVLATTIRTTGHGTAHAMTRVGGALSTYVLSRVYSTPTVGLILFLTGLWTASASTKLPETNVKDMGVVHYPESSPRRQSRRQRRRSRRSSQQRRQSQQHPPDR